MSDDRRLPPAPDKPVRRFRLSVKHLLVIIASFAVTFAAARAVWEIILSNASIGTIQTDPPRDLAGRIRAVHILGQVEPGDIERAIPPLTAKLNDAEVGIRNAAAQALSNVLARASGSSADRKASERGVAALLMAMKDRDAGVRFSAISGVPVISDRWAARKAVSPATEADDGRVWISALVAALGDRDASVREAAARALRIVGPRASRAVPSALIAALRHESAEVRAEAVSCVVAYQTGIDPLVPTLLDLLDRDESQVRAAGLRAAWECRPSPAVVPRLIEALESPKAEVRSASAAMLGNIGPSARAAIPGLTAALKQECTHVYAEFDVDPSLDVARALGEIARGSEREGEVVSALMETLASEHCPTRKWAARALEKLGPTARPAVPALMATLKNALSQQKHASNGEWPNLESACISALAEIARGTTAEGEAVGALVQALDSEHPDLHNLTATVLGRFGPRASAAIPRLHAILQDPYPVNRDAAAAALKAIEGQGEIREAPPC